MFKKKQKIKPENYIEHLRQSAKLDIQRRNQAKAAKTNFKDLFAEDTANNNLNK